MNVLHDIPSCRITDGKFEAVIEISKGSKAKYEIDKATGMLRLDRILYTSTVYPANYGFIPLTLADDGDALDVLVLSGEPILPMTLVECAPIGVIDMNDGGRSDEKIIAVCLGDPTFKGYTDISQLPRHVLDEMSHFFGVYKTLENKVTGVGGLSGAPQARAAVLRCIENYKTRGRN